MELTNPTIRIILIDDQTLFRAGLCMLLESHSGFQVVGSTGNSADAFELVARLNPDMILFEASLSGGASLDDIPSLIEKAGLAKLILVTASSDPQIHYLAVQNGAVGIIQKNQSPEMLFKAIEKVHHGEVWIERSMMANFLNQMKGMQNGSKGDQEADKINLLSQREREVLYLIGKGFKNKDVANQLSISETTVSHHLTSIFNKLGVSDRLELIIFAYRFGLVKPAS